MDARLLRRLTGFARRDPIAAYVLRPESLDDLREALEWAQRKGRRVALRGAGRSYGDAATLREEIVLDLTSMSRILEFDERSGEIEAEGGATIGDLCRELLPHGRWLWVAPGTSRPTLGGAVAMNIHGKDQFRVGSFGNHVFELDLMLASGEIRSLRPGDDHFPWCFGSAGLLGVVTRVRLGTREVGDGMILASAMPLKNWSASFRAFGEQQDADFLVETLDLFASGGAAGRGSLQRGELMKHSGTREVSLPSGKDRSEVLKLLAGRGSMRLANAFFAREQFAGRETPIERFQFQLDGAVGWEQAWGREGFFQLQSFVPVAAASTLFEEHRARLAEAGLSPWLSVMKRHRPDGFPLSPNLDGYSLALDVIPRGDWGETEAVLRRLMADVIAVGGRFYLAKDALMSAHDLRESYGDETVDRLRAVKKCLDPGGLFASDLGVRLGLD